MLIILSTMLLWNEETKSTKLPLCMYINFSSDLREEITGFGTFRRFPSLFGFGSHQKWWSTGALTLLAKDFLPALSDAAQSLESECSFPLSSYEAVQSDPSPPGLFWRPHRILLYCLGSWRHCSEHSFAQAFAWRLHGVLNSHFAMYNVEELPECAPFLFSALFTSPIMDFCLYIQRHISLQFSFIVYSQRIQPWVSLHKLRGFHIHSPSPPYHVHPGWVHSGNCYEVRRNIRLQWRSLRLRNASTMECLL
ncbi:uncharacterized protein LOC110597028 isoform X1 [Ictidomys tridecemlineatus]